MDCAQPIFLFKLFSSFHVRTALKLLPTARLSRGTNVLLEKEQRCILAHGAKPLDALALSPLIRRLRQ
jgi:hypothetical protein